MIHNRYGKVNGQCEVKGWYIFIEDILPHLTTVIHIVVLVRTFFPLPSAQQAKNCKIFMPKTIKEHNVFYLYSINDFNLN